MEIASRRRAAGRGCRAQSCMGDRRSGVQSGLTSVMSCAVRFGTGAAARVLLRACLRGHHGRADGHPAGPERRQADGSDRSALARSRCPAAVGGGRTGPRVDVALAAGRDRRASAPRAGIPFAGHHGAGSRWWPQAACRRWAATALACSPTPQLVGLSTLVSIGWLDVTGDGAAIYVPHTCDGLRGPAA